MLKGHLVHPIYTYISWSEASQWSQASEEVTSEFKEIPLFLPSTIVSEPLDFGFLSSLSSWMCSLAHSRYQLAVLAVSF